MNKITYLFLLLSVLLGACKKNIYTFGPSVSELKVTETEFDYLSAKVKIDYKDGKNDFSATTNIRMKKDSIVWFSITKGIEASRGIVTQDSLVILDKVKKTYSIFTFDELSQQFGIDLDYSLMESAIVGNLIFPYKEESVNEEDKYYHYQQKIGRFLFNNYIGMQSNKLEKLEISDEDSGSSLMVDYANFQLVEDQLLPYEVNSKFLFFDETENKNKETIVNIVYNKATLEKKPLRFPFNIPQKYVLK